MNKDIGYIKGPSNIIRTYIIAASTLTLFFSLFVLPLRLLYLHLHPKSYKLKIVNIVRIVKIED